MAKVVNLEEAQTATGQLRHWLYNAMDCIGTREVFDTLLPRLDEDTSRTYAFERALQAPLMTMARRGVLVDVESRKEAVQRLEKEARAIAKAINAMPLVIEYWDGVLKVTGACKKSTRKDGKHVWEKGVEDTPKRLCTCCGTARFAPSPFNPGSDDQAMRLFYGLLGIKEMKNKAKKVSVDDDVLERMGAKNERVRPICEAIRNYRGVKKQVGFLNARLTADNRFKSSISSGPWTGRLSSSKYLGYYGGNLQNIAEQNRFIFIADPGMELCYADLQKAESHVVSYLAGDEKYIEAHEGPYDTHTFVTRLCWPDLPWTGDPKEDKKFSSTQNPPWDLAEGHDWRFQGKRIAHAKNIGQTPQGTAMVAHISLPVARAMHAAHRAAFPYISAYQDHVRLSVVNQEAQINPLRRKVHLFGRPKDDGTWRQALAFRQQSPVADVINIGLWHVWNELDGKGVELLAQVHDALLFQFPKGEYEYVRRVIEIMSMPMEVEDYRGNKRTITIGVDAKCGLNWGKQGPSNPHGLHDIEV